MAIGVSFVDGAAAFPSDPPAWVGGGFASTSRSQGSAVSSDCAVTPSSPSAPCPGCPPCLLPDAVADRDRALFREAALDAALREGADAFPDPGGEGWRADVAAVLEGRRFAVMFPSSPWTSADVCQASAACGLDGFDLVLFSRAKPDGLDVDWQVVVEALPGETSAALETVRHVVADLVSGRRIWVGPTRLVPVTVVLHPSVCGCCGERFRIPAFLLVRSSEAEVGWCDEIVSFLSAPDRFGPNIASWEAAVRRMPHPDGRWASHGPDRRGSFLCPRCLASAHSPLSPGDAALWPGRDVAFWQRRRASSSWRDAGRDPVYVPPPDPEGWEAMLADRGLGPEDSAAAELRAAVRAAYDLDLASQVAAREAERTRQAEVAEEVARADREVSLRTRREVLAGLAPLLTVPGCRVLAWASGVDDGDAPGEAGPRILLRMPFDPDCNEVLKRAGGRWSPSERAWWLPLPTTVGDGMYAVVAEVLRDIYARHGYVVGEASP